MKSLTVQLPDDVYERAERRAAERGAVLPKEVADFVKRYGQDEGTAGVVNGEGIASAELRRLFAALDAARNVTSVGLLARGELYDRPILH